MPENPEISEAEEAWRAGVLTLLRGMLTCMERLVAYQEIPVKLEPSAASHETPGAAEPPLSTWILSDSLVARLEREVEAEQRVRGQAYGG